MVSSILYKLGEKLALLNKTMSYLEALYSPFLIAQDRVYLAGYMILYTTRLYYAILRYTRTSGVRG